MATTRIIHRNTEQDVARLEHVYRNGVQPDCKEEYRDVRVDEEHGCYHTPEEGDNDPMNWGRQD
jgi:hypothetical protein